MTKSIIEKLRRHLAESIDTECKVVYLLCEVRKLLDKVPPAPTPFALRLYCHWALHVDLTHSATTLPFLKRVDAYIDGKLNQRETNDTIVAEYTLFREFVYFETMRNELSQLLRIHKLPMGLCDKNEQWFRFLKA